jgi:hypothetical protein
MPDCAQLDLDIVRREWDLDRTYVVVTSSGTVYGRPGALGPGWLSTVIASSATFILVALFEPVGGRLIALNHQGAGCSASHQ